jgi:hypothetical protein
MPLTHCQQQAREIAEALRGLVRQAERVGIDFGDHVFKNAAAQMELIRHDLLDRAGT